MDPRRSLAVLWRPAGDLPGSVRAEPSVRTLVVTVSDQGTDFA
jgi:hypothetical protein